MTERLQHLTDAELVVASRDGDQTAFQELVERHYRVLYVIAYGRLRSHEAAEDLVQEVFLRTWLFLDRMRQPAEVGGWMTQVARNLAVDWLRRDQRRSALVQCVPVEEHLEVLEDKQTVGGPEVVARREDEAAIREAILRLPDEQRDFVLLHYSEGLPQKEIARRLGVHPSTVTRGMKKALAMMKRRLSPALVQSIGVAKPRKQAVVRTTLLIAAVAVLPQSAKAALVSAAAKSSIASVIGSACTANCLSQSIKSGFVTGGSIMLSKKSIVVLLTGIIATAGVISYIQWTAHTGLAQPLPAQPQAAQGGAPWVAATTNTAGSPDANAQDTFSAGAFAAAVETPPESEEE